MIRPQDMITNGAESDRSKFTTNAAPTRRDRTPPCRARPGYPERFAQQALGHNSKAVHHA